MKKASGLVITILVVAAILGGYYFFSQKHKSNVDSENLTEVQKLINKDLEKNYPETPREVIKLYNRIIKAYYDGNYTDDEFDALTDQALLLMDDDLKAQNPKDTYVENLKEEIAQYAEDKKKISRANVCDSNEVKYTTDNGDDIAYVSTSYFMKAGDAFEDTDQMYVLRKDDEGRWKILVYYQIEPSSTEED